jgi:geranylgeranyl pyrophosphate synthase
MPDTRTDEFAVLTRSALQSIDAELVRLLPDIPESLYEPLRYLHKAGGKRIRPLLTFLTSRQAPDAHWLPAAVAVECLHTFTILAGDVLIAIAFESLSRGNYDPLRAMLAEFATAFRRVCEGQALDKEFENAEAVTIDAYFTMIDLKSAKMIEWVPMQPVENISKSCGRLLTILGWHFRSVMTFSI